MDNIKVESAGINSSISEFASQMAEMESLLANIKETTNNVKSFWIGEDSDAILAIINNFMKSFEVIEQKNKGYSDFLEKVILDYKSKDDQISSSVLM